MDFIKQDGKILIEQPCKYCGGVFATLHEGKGPHAAEVKCKECRRHVKWASRADLEILECYKSESPVDALMVKILNAKSELEQAELNDDWVERKVATKKVARLEEEFSKIKDNSAFTGYGT